LRAGHITQGGSTISQQLIKNLTGSRAETFSRKIREAQLASLLEREYSKKEILELYLNDVYLGNGAYGLEAAAETYFKEHASELSLRQGALLAGMIANPSAYDPIQHPRAARHRRDVVLLKMLQQGFLIRYQYDAAIREALPTRSSISPPHEDTRYPYFTSWIKQQVVDELGGGQEGARLAFEGGLRVKTTIDSKLQDAAQHAVDQWLPWKGGPRAALVAIDNRTGAVRAMVGGDDYNASPFNVATQGQRQPGSSIKPFIYARAIADGISPMSVWPSHRLVIPVPHSAEKFTVSNFEDAYAGSSTLINALTHSDNSVFAQVGLKVGTRRVARLMHRMGIRTPVSHNYAMTLGGLKQGVTPLDMAHAYSTLADHGRLTYGTLSPGAGNRPHQVAPGPVGIESITRLGADKPVELPGGEPAVNRRRTRKVLDPGVADTVATGMRSVVAAGTGTRAQITGYEVAGKTGTTENYGDAWFVGFAGNYTVAIWVGFPNKLKSMATDFNGGPVEGGTFPAAIFRSFLSGVLPPPKHPAPSTTVPAIPGTTTPVPQATPAAPIAPAVPTAAPPPAATATPAPTATPVPTAAPTTPTTPPAGTDGTTGAGGATGAGGTTPTG
jgi:penicillin-binding protein 1A